MKIGLIGTGMLGNAVGLHLLQSGYQLTAFNRTKEKTNELKKDGAQIVQKLLENLQAAVLEHNKSKRANALATSIDAFNMTSVEPEIDRALVVRLAGGGEARAYNISDVSLQDVSGLDLPGSMRATATWKTLATGGHWGHAHQREIIYQGIIDLAPIDNSWKLTGFTVTKAQ